MTRKVSPMNISRNIISNRDTYDMPKTTSKQKKKKKKKKKKKTKSTSNLFSCLLKLKKPLEQALIRKENELNKIG